MCLTQALRVLITDLDGWINSLVDKQMTIGLYRGFPGGSDRKESAYNVVRTGFNPWVKKIPWRRERQPTPVFLLGKFPWIEEPGRLQSMLLQSVRHNLVTNTHTYHIGLYMTVNIYIHTPGFHGCINGLMDIQDVYIFIKNLQNKLIPWIINISWRNKLYFKIFEA